jgi:putative ABC transport system substrate-binding protein
MGSRRQALIALCAASIAVPLQAFAQQRSKPRRIGFLATYASSANLEWRAAFKNGMRELGYLEGRDYLVEYRFAEGDGSRLQALAAELVALNVELIVAGATAAAVAAHDKSRKIPIVIVTAAVPIEAGLAKSLSRPGMNVTGLTGLGGALQPKRLELMRDILPQLQRVGDVLNPEILIDRLLAVEFQSGAKKLGITIVPLVVRTGSDVDAAFIKLKQENAHAVFVSPTVVNLSLRESLIEHAARHRVPAMYGSAEFAEKGGLISYSANFVDQYRRAAAYVDRIFKGANPAELPIEQPTKFDLVVNLRTAKALGLEIPRSILLRADRVIE